MTTTEVPAQPVTGVSLPVSALRDALTAAHLAIATGATVDAVPALGMVHIAKRGSQLIARATNRYHLLEATAQLHDTTPPADDWEALLIGADVKRLLTALPKTVVGAVHVSPDPDGMLTVAADDGASIRLKLQDGDFPKTDGLFPKERVALDGVRFDTKLLATLAKMPGRGKNNWVKFWFSGEQKPVVSTWEDEDTHLSYRYLLMPVRDA